MGAGPERHESQTTTDAARARARPALTRGWRSLRHDGSISANPHHVPARGPEQAECTKAVLVRPVRHKAPLARIVSSRVEVGRLLPVAKIAYRMGKEERVADFVYQLVSPAADRADDEQRPGAARDRPDELSES